MKNIILCEGKTDMILISLYLERTKQWQFFKNATQVNPKKDGVFPLPVTPNTGEAAAWYHCDGRNLAIWAVNGHGGFARAIHEVTLLNRRVVAAEGFAKVVLIRDRDQQVQNGPILTEFATSFAENGVTLQLSNAQWNTAEYQAAFDQKAQLQVLPLIIPFDKPGALETFLLDSLAETEEEAKIVQVCRDFVKNTNSDKYLPTDRIRLKAELATTFALLSPERVFTDQREMLESIPWEQFRTVQTGFQLLEQI